MANVETAMAEASNSSTSKCWAWTIKYGIDIINIIVGLGVAMILPREIFDTMSPAKKEFPGSYQPVMFQNINDPNDYFISISYVKNPTNDREYEDKAAIDSFELFVLSALPIVYVICFVYFYFFRVLKWNGKYLYYEVISFCYAYLISMGFVYWFTHILKILIAWTRPDFWARCNPKFSFADITTLSLMQLKNGTIDIDINFNNITTNGTFYYSRMDFETCDYKNFEFYDDYSDYQKGFTSFPSGHTSYLFCGSIMLAYFTYGKFNHPFLKAAKDKRSLINPQFDKSNKIARLIGMKWLRTYVQATTTMSGHTIDDVHGETPGAMYNDVMAVEASSNGGSDDNDEKKNDNDDIDNKRKRKNSSRSKKRKNSGEPDKYYYVLDTSLIMSFILATWTIWGATWVAISRIDDQRHYPTDLIGGALLGLACATFGYTTQYDYGQAFSKRVLRKMKHDYEYFLKAAQIGQHGQFLD